MQSKAFSISIVSLFVAGVVAWYAARYWAFGRFHFFSLLAIVLAIALAVNYLRGDVTSRWLTLAFSLFGAYSSFNLFLYIRTKSALIDSREVTGEVFILPGTLFSICAVVLIASYLAGQLRGKRSPD